MQQLLDIRIDEHRGCHNLTCIRIDMDITLRSRWRTAWYVANTRILDVIWVEITLLLWEINHLNSILKAYSLKCFVPFKDTFTDGLLPWLWESIVQVETDRTDRLSQLTLCIRLLILWDEVPTMWEEDALSTCTFLRNTQTNRIIHTDTWVHDTWTHCRLRHKCYAITNTNSCRTLATDRHRHQRGWHTIRKVIVNDNVCIKTLYPTNERKFWFWSCLKAIITILRWHNRDKVSWLT